LFLLEHGHISIFWSPGLSLTMGMADCRHMVSPMTSPNAEEKGRGPLWGARNLASTPIPRDSPVLSPG
jgi:hypothetical protein